MAGTLPESSSSGAAATTSSSPPPSPGVVSKWTSEQDKLFEKALLNWEEDECPKWDELAALVPGKTLAEVKKHFEFLVQDVKNIEGGLIPLPCYTSRDALVKEQSSSSPTGVESKKTPLTSPGGLYHHQQHHHHHANGGSGNTSAPTPPNASNTTGGTSSTSKTKTQDQERRKGIPWTEDEHRLFLLGLEKFGKGDWRSISRNFVVSRTPTQVASHAQKYFIRLNSIHKDKRRTSIHDITSVNGDGRQQTQGPITGQSPGGGSGNGGGNPSPATGAAVGQPYTPVGPAVGTPVVPMNQPVPVPVHHHGGYPPGARSRPVPGTPLNVAHMAYPMPQPAMHH